MKTKIQKVMGKYCVTFNYGVTLNYGKQTFTLYPNITKIDAQKQKALLNKMLKEYKYD